MTVSLGPRKIVLSRDSDGHREYRVTYKIEGTILDGPATALLTPGLPRPGNVWTYKGETDPWAFCRLDAQVTPEDDTESTRFWNVEFLFSTRSPDTKSCKETQVEDPLLEPAKVSGSFIKFLEEATHDRFGRIIRTSSFEQIRGSQVEFDRNRMQIRISQNVAGPLQGYQLPAQMLDCLNATDLWGLPPRCIKLSAAPWDRRFFGMCNVYYERNLEFEINIRVDPLTGLYMSGFDRDLLDEGTKVLHGHWHPTTATWILDEIDGGNPHYDNPQHYIKYKDRRGENTKVILNGRGIPAGVAVPSSEVTVVTNVQIDNHPGLQTLNVAAQPLTATNLVIYLTDEDGSIGTGTITVKGKDSAGGTIREDFDIGGFGSTSFTTAKKYKTITEIYLNGVVIAEPASEDRIEVKSSALTSTEGIIRVEKYFSADFLLLGIPLTF